MELSGRTGGERVTCPLDGSALTLPTFEYRDGGMTLAAVQVDPGTLNTHIRDEHPEFWADHCDFRRRMNASGRYGLSRRVDGTLMWPGDDVGDLGAALT